MKKIKTKPKPMKIAISAIIITLLILCPTINADIGLGVSPASITVSDALKGGTYEKQ